MVGQDIPPYCIAQGDRCRLRGINVIALRRAGFDEEAIRDIRRLYRILSEGSTKPDAFEQRIKERNPELLNKPYVQSFFEFVRSSSRGLTTPSKHQAGS
jgi:UDP-N-acetylglucosamine acyltransferase